METIKEEPTLMSEEPETLEETSEAGDQGEEEVEIEEATDLNIALLEIMIERTNLLENAMEGKISLNEAAKLLAETKMPRKARRVVARTAKKAKKSKKAKKKAKSRTRKKS